MNAQVCQRPVALVVEDDEAIAALLTYLLDRIGYDVEIVRAAPEAEAQLARTRFDLVTVDLALPAGHGESVVALASRAGMRVIVISASNAAAKVAATHGVRHLAKPFRIADFEACLAP